MNALNLTLDEFQTQREIINNIPIPLYPEWEDYEKRKRMLQQMNLSTSTFQKEIKELAREFNL